MSTNDRCGDICRLDSARALVTSPDFTASGDDLTPWRSSMFTVGSGLPPGRSRMNSGRSGPIFVLCSSDSASPGAEIEPVMKATPTGSKALGGRALDASPAQKLWRSPDTVAKPVIFWSRMKSKTSARSVMQPDQSPPPPSA